jgi:hypothetical protein
MDLKWLDKITRDGKYLFYKQTCLVVHDSKQYAFKSDGILFVAVESDDANLPASDRPLADIMDPIKKSTVHVISLDALKKWLGAADWDDPCDVCKGEGYMPPCPSCGHQMMCEECGGEGGSFAAPDYGQLFGIAINKNLLARGLEGITEPAVVKAHINDKEKVQYISGDGWIVGIMPIDERLINQTIESKFDDVCE